MSYGKQTKLAKKTGFSDSFISQILNGKKRVKYWATAKILAEATNTDPELWLEKSADEIRAAVLV